MRRQLIVLGLAVFALLVFAFISATLAAPENTPLLQGSESEPNNSFSEADAVPVPGYIIGEVNNTPVTETLDYFVVSTLGGHKYRASLTIVSPQGLNLGIGLWNGNEQWIDNSAPSASSTSISWTANTLSHYIRVEAVTVSTSTVKTAGYCLDVFEMAEPPDWDDCEPNDSFYEVYDMPIAMSAVLEDLNFYPYGNRAGPDEDWFAFYVMDGHWYQATTENLIGVDTYMEIRNRNNSVVESDDDDGPGFGSQARWYATYGGYYYIRVINLVATGGPDDTYDLTVSEVNPGATSVWLPLCFRRK
jgi:hypothetical protein